MTAGRDVDRLLDLWLAEGAAEMSDRALVAALDIVEHTSQRRVLRLPWRNQSMLVSMRLVAAAALVVVVGVGGAYLLRSTSPQVGQSPAPSALGSPPASPTSATSTGPASVPGAAPTVIPGTSLATGPSELVPGKTYSTGQFDPAFAIKGQNGWWYLDGGPGSAWFGQGPNEPHGPDVYSLGIVTVAKVIPPAGSAGSSSVPSDLVLWLQSRPDLALAAPKSVTVGGFRATALVGSVRTEVTGNAGVNLFCPADAFPCANGQPGALGFAANGAFEVVVIPVHGKFVVIGLQGPSADWTSSAKTFDPFLAGLTFPGLSN